MNSTNKNNIFVIVLLVIKEVVNKFPDSPKWRYSEGGKIFSYIFKNHSNADVIRTLVSYPSTKDVKGIIFDMWPFPGS